MKKIRWVTLAAPMFAVACHDGILLGGDGGNGTNETMDAQAYLDVAAPGDAMAPGLDSGVELDAMAPTEDAFFPGDAQVTLDAMPGTPLVYFYGNPANPSSGSVYGTASGSASHVPVALGSPSQDIGAVIGIANAFDVSLGTAYFSAEDFGSDGAVTYSVYGVSNGVAPHLVVSGFPGAITALAADATYVYVLREGTTPATGALERVPVGGGSVDTLAAVPAPVGAMTLNTGYLYWTTRTSPGADGGASGAIMRIQTAAGPAETVATGQLDPIAIAVESGNVYWLNHGTPQVDCTTTDGSLVELPAGSSTPVVLAASLKGPRSLVAGTGAVYFSTSGQFCNSGGTGAGGVFRAPAGGGSVTPLATGLTQPDNLVADGTFLYFTVVTDPLSYVLGVDLLGI